MSGNKVIIGVILITIGFIFLLANLNLIDLSFDEIIFDFWPVVLIVIGAVLIYRKAKHKDEKIEAMFRDYNQNLDQEQKRYSNIGGDQHYETKGIEIDGLSISGVFGDISLNLAESVLKPGVNRVDLSGVFGDITVVIPQNYEVAARGSNTFGDLHILGQKAEGFGNSLTKKTAGYDTASTKLAVSSSTTFGDIKIYRA